MPRHAARSAAVPPMKRTLIPGPAQFADLLGYSRLVAIGDDAWISGCAPTSADGKLQGEECAYRQTRQCIDNIGDALTEAGFLLADVVRTRVYIKSFDDLDAVMRAHLEYFRDIRPACTVIAAADLVLPGMLVYMDADARRAPRA